MSRRTGFLVTVLMVVMWSLAAGAADAASPSGATVGPGNRSAGWAGKVFVLGATQSPSLCPLPQDSNDILCDHFSLTVGVSPGYWSTHSGGIGVSIRWASSSDNFDLYLYDSSGSQVAASAAPSGTTEHVSLAKASGKYEVRVVPKLVKNSGYSGGASFSSQNLPPPSPKPKPPPPGGGGSGGSGGAGGAGSGNGFYQPGAYVPFGGGGYFGSGGTNSFGGSPSATTSRRVYYVGQGGTQAGARASNASQAFTAGRLSRLLWILVPIGLFLFAAAGLAVFHPDEERERRTGTVAVRQGVVGTVPPESLAGLTVSAVGLLWRAIAALARGLRHVSLWGWRRFRR